MGTRGIRDGVGRPSTVLIPTCPKDLWWKVHVRFEPWTNWKGFLRTIIPILFRPWWKLNLRWWIPALAILTCSSAWSRFTMTFISLWRYRLFWLSNKIEAAVRTMLLRISTPLLMFSRSAMDRFLPAEQLKNFPEHTIANNHWYLKGIMIE